MDSQLSLLNRPTELDPNLDIQLCKVGSVLSFDMIDGYLDKFTKIEALPHANCILNTTIALVVVS